VEIVFERSDGFRRPYFSFAARGDGVMLRVAGGSYHPLEPPLPHDLAHYVVEHSLGLDRGFWGVLAAGGLFPQATVVSGKQAAHAKRRGLEVVRYAQAGQCLTQAEVLVTAIVEIARRDVSDWQSMQRRIGRRWLPEGLTAETVTAIKADLYTANAEWNALRPGDSMTRRWSVPLLRWPPN
jgi:hypothetical protein